VTDADARVARVGHAEASRQLEAIHNTPTVPNSFEVRQVLIDFGIDVRREEIVKWCNALALPLADDDLDESEITRKLPSQH
jgi:hypothetical protein